MGAGCRYFDGDGSPKAHMNMYTITLSVAWSDQDIEIIEHLAQFLRDRGVFGNFEIHARRERLL